MKKQKILITGSAGFIGSNIAKKMNKKFIYGIGRVNKKFPPSSIFKKNINKNITLKNLNLFKEKFDFIIHCAGGGIGLSNFEDYKKNFLPTKNVLEYIRKYSTKTKLIFLSSLSVYGNKKKKLSEEDTLDPLSTYAKNKIKSEKLCKLYSNKYNISILILRVGPVYGIGLRKRFFFDACTKITNNNNIFMGTGNESRDYLYIDDFTNLIKKILSRKMQKFDIVNVGSGIQFKIVDIIKFIKKKLGNKERIFFNKEGLSKNPKYLVSKNEKIKKYKWKPKKKLFDGLNNYIEWFKIHCD
jgi:UDP-glucose 4-epimerase